MMQISMEKARHELGETSQEALIRLESDHFNNVRHSVKIVQYDRMSSLF